MQAKNQTLEDQSDMRNNYQSLDLMKYLKRKTQAR